MLEQLTESAATSTPKEAQQQINKHTRKIKIKSGSLISIVTSIVCLVLIVLILFKLIMHFTSNQERTFTIDHEANTFLMDGQPFRYISGSIHYFRAVPAAWPKRLRSMKAAGLNAIDIYIEWSLHNPREGVYTWSGIADVEKFIKLAQREGFYIILRPGPYICAERDNGGLPYWLFEKYPGIKMRTSDTNYTHEVSVWYGQLMPRIQRFLYGNGGPIIMVQVENEYGSFSACDHEYMKWMRDETRKYVDGKALLFTIDYPAESLECGRVEDVFVTLDFGIKETKKLPQMWKKLRTVQPTGPLVNSEFYAGWLTHWHEKNKRLDPHAVADALETILASNASVNIYMFFGGTNFGFTAGANDFNAAKYAPDITSYDYDAPLDEWGNTTKKFELIRNVIGRHFRLPNIKPVKETTFCYGQVDLKPTMHLLSPEARSLLGNAETLETGIKSFEEFGQFSGLLLYEASIEDLEITDNSLLTVSDLRDRALVYIDQEFKGVLSRQQRIFTLNFNASKGSTLQILVENQGRINYNTANDTKGIMGAVTWSFANGTVINLTKWRHCGFPLEDLKIEQILLNTKQVAPETSNLLLQGPVIYYGEFWVKKPHHTFLNPTGWGKGVAYVNGFNLGRYWPSAGPQLTLYVPQEILVNGQNSLVMLEYEQTNRACDDVGPFVILDNKPQLDK